MLSYLLDTHIYVWWRIGSGKLSREQALALDHAEASGDPVGLSSISIWEMSMLLARGRLELNQIPAHVWLRQVENDPGLKIFPMDADVCTESANLPTGFHRDPADRIIVATARVHGLRLLTADERIVQWGKVPLVA
jgi:PIN domain nuclease of toxin-antitoxin system